MQDLALHKVCRGMSGEVCAESAGQADRGCALLNFLLMAKELIEDVQALAVFIPVRNLLLKSLRE